MVLDDAVEGFVDIVGHAGSVAADVEDGSFVEPCPKLGTFFEHAVLHVDFLRLVAGECGGELIEGAIGLVGGEFVLVEVFGLLVLLAEDEPGIAFGIGGFAVLEKRAERCDPGAGAAHDHGSFVIGLGKAEAFAGSDEAGDLGVVFQGGGQAR